MQKVFGMVYFSMCIYPGTTPGHRTFPASQQMAWCPFSVNSVHSPPRPLPPHIHTLPVLFRLSLINELGRFWNFTQLGSCDRDSFMSGSFAQCDDSEIQLCMNQQFTPLIGWMFTWRWTGLSHMTSLPRALLSKPPVAQVLVSGGVYLEQNAWVPGKCRLAFHVQWQRKSGWTLCF